MKKRLTAVFPDVLLHQGFKLNYGGYSYKDYSFGTKVTVIAKHELNTVFHEIAHAIEFGAENFEERTNNSGGFLFRVPTSYLCGNFYADHQTMNATKRELRTWAIQIALLKASGVKKSKATLAKELVSSMVFMSDAGFQFSNKVKMSAKRQNLDIDNLSWEER